MGKHLFSFPFVFLFFSSLFLSSVVFFFPPPPPPAKAEYNLCKNSSGQSQAKPSAGCCFFSFFLVDFFFNWAIFFPLFFLFCFLLFLLPKFPFLVLPWCFPEIQAAWEGGAELRLSRADKALLPAAVRELSHCAASSWAGSEPQIWGPSQRE